MKNIDLISYGSISKDFKIIAQLSNFLNDIKNGAVPPQRLDCYPIERLTKSAQRAIEEKFKSIELEEPLNKEVFLPSQNYPSHVDEGGISYFIPLEDGLFLIGDNFHRIIPFVLYAFEDSRVHNTDFGAIMLK